MKEEKESYEAPFERIYNHIVKHGVSAFSEDIPVSLYAHKNKPLLERLIRHFEVEEQYEKCCFLKIIQDNLNV